MVHDLNRQLQLVGLKYDNTERKLRSKEEELEELQHKLQEKTQAVDQANQEKEMKEQHLTAIEGS